MKTIRWLGMLGLVAWPLWSGLAQDVAPNPPAVYLSPASAEILKLSQAGMTTDVIQAYVQNSQSQFDLSADALIYLKDVGVAPAVVAAMLSHDSALRAQGGGSSGYVYQQQNYGTPSQENATTPAPSVPPVAETPAPVPVPADQPAPTPAVAPAPAPVVVPAPAPVVVQTPPPQVNYFYSSLSPYGSWVMVEGYGWCWQPSVLAVNHDWTPYCDGGHWVYSDAGWYWESDYTWGWAPFHYGRWWRHERCGWIWIPDTQWAPSWVIWRSAGDHCGWAPVPPHADFDIHLGWRFNGVAVAADFDFGLRPDYFTFVATRDFGEHDFRHHRLPPAEVTRVYHQTTIINNYTVNNTVNNTVIVNRGPEVEHVMAVSHAPIQRVTVHDAPEHEAHLGMASRDAGVVYRPHLVAPEKAAPVRVQKLDAQHPVIQHAIYQRAVAPYANPVHPNNAVVGAAPNSVPAPKPHYTAPAYNPAPAQNQTARVPYHNPTYAANNAAAAGVTPFLPAHQPIHSSAPENVNVERYPVLNTPKNSPAPAPVVAVAPVERYPVRSGMPLPSGVAYQQPKSAVQAQAIHSTPHNNPPPPPAAHNAPAENQQNGHGQYPGNRNNY